MVSVPSPPRAHFCSHLDAKWPRLQELLCAGQTWAQTVAHEKSAAVQGGSGQAEALGKAVQRPAFQKGLCVLQLELPALAIPGRCSLLSATVAVRPAATVTGLGGLLLMLL